MKILVVSDIHAFGRMPDDGSRPSYVRAGDNSESSPTLRFEELVRDGTVPKPDAVVCPGDLSHQADLAGLEYAWEFLKRLAQQSALGLLAATAGNHDLDSRLKAGDFDPKGMLLDLKPSYPVVTDYVQEAAGDTQLQLMFWARNFCIAPFGDCRLVVLNSSAFHGAGRKDGFQEFEHGRISGYTLTRLRNALEGDVKAREAGGLPRTAVNVLLCHHHLEKDGLVDDTDRSEMSGANALMQLMKSSEYGRWLVIHGHRHRARLYQPGGATGPWVLSAASFGATRDRDYDNQSPNQAHLIELDFEGMSRFGFRPAGTIRSWTWRKGLGWSSDRAERGGLPPATGFGFRGSIDQLAVEIGPLVRDRVRRWDEIRSALPQVAYLAHDQLDELCKVLTAEHGVQTIIKDDGAPHELGKSG